MTVSSQIKGNFLLSLNSHKTQTKTRVGLKPGCLYQLRPGSVLVSVLFSLNTIMLSFGSLTPPGWPGATVVQAGQLEGLHLSLGNQSSTGLGPKEIHSVGPPRQLDRESAGTAEAPMWEMHQVLSYEFIHDKALVFTRCIRAAAIRSAAWGATATALNTLPLAASTAGGGRSAAIGMRCVAPATAAATVSMMGRPSPPRSPARDSTRWSPLINKWRNDVFNPDRSSESEAQFNG